VDGALPRVGVGNVTAQASTLYQNQANFGLAAASVVEINPGFGKTPTSEQLDSLITSAFDSSPNVINVYFVNSIPSDDPTLNGADGYEDPPSRAVFISAFATDDTPSNILAHEVGHSLGLEDLFLVPQSYELMCSAINNSPVDCNGNIITPSQATTMRSHHP